MVDGLHHAALAVSDVPRAVSFYEDALDFSPVGPDDASNTRETADCMTTSGWTWAVTSG